MHDFDFYDFENFDSNPIGDCYPPFDCSPVDEDILKHFHGTVSLNNGYKSYLEGKISEYTYSKYKWIFERDENKFYEQFIFNKIRELYYEVKRIHGSNKAKQKAYVGAYYLGQGKLKGFIKVDCSGTPPENINRILYDLSEDVGKINEHIQGSNYVGCCAEFRVINFLLNKHADINYIRFTRAFQFDGGKLVTIPYCSNCRKMFQKYPHLLKRDSESTDTEIEL